jgi:CDP-diacylglycerol--serine O-phosphatidyltransferase
VILGPDGVPLPDSVDENEHELDDVEASRSYRRLPGGLTLRALAPNAITSAALCSGLTGIRFATDGQWEKAVLAVILAGVLDGVDGRVARAMKAQSRFGAELDSLADNVSFGVAPALILFMWSLHDVPQLGWLAALALAVCCALRLARFNARIDLADQPHKSAGFLTGVPAPVGAGLIAFLLISNIATPSWGSARPRRNIRLELIALVGLTIAALLTVPWWTLVGLCAVYLAVIPIAVVRYSRVKRQRAALART